MKTIAARAYPKRGFTLLEVLLSLALLGGLLVALNVFVFSMAEVWGHNRDRRLFDQHARAVTRHVTQLLEDAAFGAAGSGLEVKEVAQTYGLAQPRITFVLAAGSRLFAWPDKPLPDVEVALGVVERAGLALSWQSRLEERFGEDTPRIAVVSPFVVTLAYDYYDESFKRWKTEAEITRDANGAFALPGRLRIGYQQGEYTAEHVVEVPVRGEGATWY
ncbi:MAG: prepilin-type N-terminal cleavage/methylation domain-containing protein [Verrucomicrobiota bacterium]